MIETAMIAPVLATMALGTYEGGRIVEREQNLQSAATEAEAIVLAAAAGSGVTSTKLKDMLVASTGLSANQINLVAKYRCGNATTFVNSATSCPAGQQVYQFIQATLTSTYTPTWANYGIGSPVNYTVVRTVQVG